MIKALFKHPLFLIGFSFVFLLFLSSIIHSLFFDGGVPQQKMLYEGGHLVDQAPLSPAQYPPFGTNKLGDSLFFQILLGAKYTISLAIIVAALRIILSVILGIFYGNYLMKVNSYFSKVIEAFHYVPMSLLAYVILRPVLLENGLIGQFQYSFSERILFEIAVLTIIALPTTTLLVGNETSLILKQEFITSVKLMGGSRFYILRKHVIPYMMPRLWVQFAQAIIQVLILLVHLGVFSLFFGGTHVTKGPGGGSYSIYGEWSGLIGEHILNFMSYPWMVLTPLVMFALTILAMNFILEGLKAVLSKNKVSKASKKILDQEKKEPINQQPFDFVNRQTM